MHTLPILVPGRTEPVTVPCELLTDFSIDVFLPSRGGLRRFDVVLTTSNPLEAEVGSVTLSNPEADPRLSMGDGYEVDSDEQQRADEAAADVLVDVLCQLGMNPRDRIPEAYVQTDSILYAIARAWVAEEDAVSLQSAMCSVLRAAGLHNADRDAYALVPDLASAKGRAASPACEAMRGYVAHALDAAVEAQRVKAEAQQANHPSPDDEDEAGSERVRNPRHLDSSTLRCLDVEY